MGLAFEVAVRGVARLTHFTAEGAEGAEEGKYTE
jgi:hypothetical protein